MDPPGGDPIDPPDPLTAEAPPADDPADPPGGDPVDPPDPVAAERARVKAIRAQAKKCGVPADSDLVEALIDDGISVALAGKQLLAFKQSLQQASAVHGHQTPTPQPGNTEQIQASWEKVYQSTRRR